MKTWHPRSTNHLKVSHIYGEFLEKWRIHKSKSDLGSYPHDLQYEAPKIAKLVYNSNVTMVYGTQITN